MDTGEVGCEWRDGESLRTSYLFVSRKRDVIVKRITSTSPDLEMTFGMDIHYNTTRDSAEKYAKHVLETKECSVRDSFINYTALNDDGTLPCRWYMGRESRENQIESVLGGSHLY